MPAQHNILKNKPRRSNVSPRGAVRCLGVNIDHVATLRQVRLAAYPDVLRAAGEACCGGADSITVHLREDRRHIQERDVRELKRRLRVPLNLEMAMASDVVKIALQVRPEKVCLVPEKRQELTTEGGLDVVRSQKALRRLIPKLKKKRIEVSLFIDPVPAQIRTAAALGSDAVELHTGAYANARGRSQKKRELEKLQKAVAMAALLGLKVNAGHGLDLQNVKALAKIPVIEEFNIGHSIVARAVFVGLRKAVSEMKQIIARRA